MSKWWSMSVQQLKHWSKHLRQLSLPVLLFIFAGFVHMKWFCRSCGLVKRQMRACDLTAGGSIRAAVKPVTPLTRLKGSGDRSSANANPGKIRYSRHACDFWCMDVLSFKWWIINSDAKNIIMVNISSSSSSIHIIYCIYFVIYI